MDESFMRASTMTASINAAEWHLLGTSVASSVATAATQTVFSGDIPDPAGPPPIAPVAAEQGAAIVAAAVANGTGGVGLGVTIAASALAGVVGISVGALLTRRWYRMQQEAAQKAFQQQPLAPPLVDPMIEEAATAANFKTEEPIRADPPPVQFTASPALPVGQHACAEVAVAMKLTTPEPQAASLGVERLALPAPPAPLALAAPPEVVGPTFHAAADGSMTKDAMAPASAPALPMFLGSQLLAQPMALEPQLHNKAAAPVPTKSEVVPTVRAAPDAPVAKESAAAFSASALPTDLGSQLRAQPKVTTEVAACAVAGLGVMALFSSMALARHLLRSNAKLAVAPALPAPPQPQVQPQRVVPAVSAAGVASAAAPVLTPPVLLPAPPPKIPTLAYDQPPMIAQTDAVVAHKLLAPTVPMAWELHKSTVAVAPEKAIVVKAPMALVNPSVDIDFNIMCAAGAWRFGPPGHRATVAVVDGKVRPSPKPETKTRSFRILPPQ